MTGDSIPHGAVVGIERADDLLSLDDKAMPHRDALITLTFQLWEACLVGNPVPKVAAMYERMQHPQVGDLVVECTRAGYSSNQVLRQRGLGFLLAKHTETVRHSDPDDPATEVAWYVQYGPDPADVCRWTNVQFLTVLEAREVTP